MSTVIPTYAPQSQPQLYSSPPFSVILTIILVVFFFIGFFFIYFFRFFIEILLQSWRLQRSPSENLIRSSNSPTENPGLDPKLIQSFPCFPYSSVKDLRTQKNYGLECAICLSEFMGEDILRLLTTCYHVFHQECVDLWLESHKTCPVCRSQLESSQNVTESNDVSLRDEIIIDIIRENDDGDPAGNHRSDVTANVRTDQSSESLPENFPRSHSTGHSIVMIRPEEEDRHTLRLPEHVKIKITRGHNQTESCITFGELTRTRHSKNGGLGEVSGQNH